MLLIAWHSGRLFASTGVPEVLLRLIVDLRENTGAYVRLGNKLLSRFCTSSSVRQCCILAPDLFWLAIDWILDHMQIGGQIFSDLAYADDTAFLFTSEDSIRPCVQSFSQAAATFGLRTSWAKTKLQNLGSGPSPTSLQTDGNSVESVDGFVYLGSLQKSKAGYAMTTTACRWETRAKYGIYRKIWTRSPAKYGRSGNPG